jgi:predicted nucleotidyltransferase
MAEKHKEQEKKSVEQNLSSDYIPKSKLGNLPMSNQLPEEVKKEMNKTKAGIDKFKKDITKKYKYVEAIGIIPSQASQKIEEEYEVPEEDSKKKLIHILVIIPEEHFKDIGKVRIDAINFAKQIDEKLWVHVMTPVDVWNLCLDSKFDIVEAFAMGFPILDKGILGALRVSEVHKALVLKKFEKYVTSYVISGSLVRGTAHKDSDVDVFVVINDTDVKRMPRLELKEKLRGIIYSYIQEATAIAGVKNILNVQPYLLTEFWEAVKDASPVMFTFIRDGVPLYDRGAFLPWKSLLKMGKIKPSPEAIDMFMKSGDKLKDNIERRLLDIAVIDIYWS